MSAPTVKEEDKKVKEEKPLINLKVNMQGKPDVFFRLKTDSQLQRLMVSYCDRQSVELATCRFLFDGKRIDPQTTPYHLGMEDGDEIDVMLQQFGAGRAQSETQFQ